MDSDSCSQMTTSCKCAIVCWMFLVFSQFVIVGFTEMDNTFNR